MQLSFPSVSLRQIWWKGVLRFITAYESLASSSSLAAVSVNGGGRPDRGNACCEKGICGIGLRRSTSHEDDENKSPTLSYQCCVLTGTHVLRQPVRAVRPRSVGHDPEPERRLRP